MIGIRGWFGTWTAWNANHSNLKDSSERSKRGGKFFSGFRATYELRGAADVSGSATTWSPFMAFPGQDPEDRRESKWRTSYGRLQPFVSLSRPVSSLDRISIGRRLSTPFVIRENLETRSTLVPYATVRNDHLGWPCDHEHDVKLTGRTACQPLSILFPTSVLTYR